MFQITNHFSIYFCYRERYDLTLPDNWLSIIYDNAQLFTVIKDSLMDRVYPNISQSTANKEVCEPDSNTAPQLGLPWNEKYWNVFITSVSSTVEIWGRLIGPDYSVGQSIFSFHFQTIRSIQIFNHFLLFSFLLFISIQR